MSLECLSLIKQDLNFLLLKKRLGANEAGFTILIASLS